MLKTNSLLMRGMVRKRKAEHEAARNIAIAKGEETYIGSRCIHGHDGRRYVAKLRGICVTCYAEKNAAITAKYRAHKATPKFRAEKLFWRAKKRAAENGRDFTITVDDIVIPSHCPISGKPLRLDQSVDGLSLDRIDNFKGYVPGNVWVISHRMNTLKNNATIEEIEALLAHMRGNKAMIALVD